MRLWVLRVMTSSVVDAYFWFYLSILVISRDEPPQTVKSGC